MAHNQPRLYLHNAKIRTFWVQTANEKTFPVISDCFGTVSREMSK
jgi:hypothetical protein